MFLQSLTPSEVATVCLMIAVVSLFLAIILTVIHYITGLMSGFILGLAAGTHAWWPMLQGWFRDVAIPLVISAGSLLLWGCARLYERFHEAAIDEVVNRF